MSNKTGLSELKPLSGNFFNFERLTYFCYNIYFFYYDNTTVILKKSYRIQRYSYNTNKLG